MSEVVEKEEKSWPRVVTLRHPIEHGEERITQLTFRRGRVGDATNIKLQDKELPANDLMLIASRLSGQTLEVIKKLDVDDAGEVVDIALDFYKRFLGR